MGLGPSRSTIVGSAIEQAQSIGEVEDVKAAVDEIQGRIVDVEDEDEDEMDTT